MFWVAPVFLVFLLFYSCCFWVFVSLFSCRSYARFGAFALLLLLLMYKEGLSVAPSLQRAFEPLGFFLPFFFKKGNNSLSSLLV